MSAPNTPQGVYAKAVVAADARYSQALSVLTQLREVEPDNALIAAASAILLSEQANLHVQVSLLASTLDGDIRTLDGTITRAYIIAGPGDGNGEVRTFMGDWDKVEASDG